MLFAIGDTTTTTAIDTLIDGIPTLFGLVGDVITTIVGNPVLAFFAAIPIAYVAIRILRKLVGAAGSF